MTEWSRLKRKGESRMRELDEMISRLRNRGIKVEKVKYPKQTLSEKKWVHQCKQPLKTNYRDFNGYSFT